MSNKRKYLDEILYIEDDNKKKDKPKGRQWKVISYGSTDDTRQRVYQTYPRLVQVTDSIANEYKINPKLLRTRLAHEGFIDEIAYYHDDAVRSGDTLISKENYINSILNNSYSGFGTFGLDDVGTLIDEEKVKPIRERYYSEDNVNEKGRYVHSVRGTDNYDNIGLTAATLKYFRDEAQKTYPKAGSSELDRYANIFYNRGIAGGKKYIKNGGKGYSLKYKNGGSIRRSLKDGEINKTNGKTYVVQKGNSPWQIAHDNGITLDEFYKLNPNVKERHMIHPGDVVRLSPDEIIERINIREERNKENIANVDNISAIQSVNHDSNYIIVDKKNKQLVVYDKNNNPIYTTNEISTGLSGNDYNTITYTKNGKLINNAGNNSTPAGITTIRNVGVYHGSPSFIRERINKDGSSEDIASSIHLGNTKNRLSSNGCIRASRDTLENLSKLVGTGTKVYTLPEKEGSKFTIKGGKLNFTADNPNGETEGDKKYWDDYNTYIDKSYAPLELKWTNTGNEKYDNNRKAYANTLTNNKKLIQDLFNLSSDEYNRLAELALGIAEQESKFGTSKRYNLKQGIGSPIINMIRGNARSRGMTQIKMRTDNKQMQDYYTSQGIDEESINNAEQSAMATIGRLAGMYRDEVRGRKFIGADGVEISPEEALLYKWNGHNEQLKNNTATPEQNIYIQNVKKYANDFEMYEPRTRYIYKLGGIY